MNDLAPPPVPYLSDARLVTRKRHLIAEITTHRRRRQQRRYALGGAGLAASGFTAALVTLVGTSTPAFAAWSASPTSPAPRQLATAEANCAARPTNPPAGMPALPTELTLADTRGPFTLLLYGANTTSEGALLCMSGPDGTQLSVEEGNLRALPGSDQITLDRLQGESANGQPYTVAEGSVGSGVSAATLALSDGSSVDTTAGNGLFLAWWPGTATVTSAVLSTTSGTTTQAINPPPVDTGGSANVGGGAMNPSSATRPHTRQQRALLRAYCARLKTEGIHGPNGQPIEPCAVLGP